MGFNKIIAFVSGKDKKFLQTTWDAATQQRFDAEFPNALEAFAVLCTNKKAEKEKLFALLEIWRNCSNKVSNSRKSYAFLEILHYIKTHKNGKIIEHLIGEAGQGGHYQEEGDKFYHSNESGQNESHILIKDANNVKVSIADLRNNPANINSFGVLNLPIDCTIKIAQYRKNTNGIKALPPIIERHILKDVPDGHTFFPNDLTLDEIIEQCASAWTNPIKNSWTSNVNRTQEGNLAFEAASENGMTIRWWQQNNFPLSFFPKF